MYKDRTHNYDPEIHEEYDCHDNPFPATSFIAMTSCYAYRPTIIAINTTNYR